MILPLFFLIAVIVAYILSQCCLRSKPTKLQRGKELLVGLFVQRVFDVFIFDILMFSSHICLFLLM